RARASAAGAPPLARVAAELVGAGEGAVGVEQELVAVGAQGLGVHAGGAVVHLEKLGVAQRAEVVDQPEDVDRLDVRGVVLERLARLGLGLLELKTTEVVLGQLDPGGAALGVRGAAARTPSKRQSGQRRKDSQARPERQG